MIAWANTIRLFNECEARGGSEQTFPMAETRMWRANYCRRPFFNIKEALGMI